MILLTYFGMLSQTSLTKRNMATPVLYRWVLQCVLEGLQYALDIFTKLTFMSKAKRRELRVIPVLVKKGEATQSLHRDQTENDFS